LRLADPDHLSPDELRRLAALLHHWERLAGRRLRQEGTARVR